MFCKICGELLEKDDIYRPRCGALIKKNDKIDNGMNKKFLAVSILALVNVMFIPTTDMGVDFFEAIQKLLAYPRGYIDAWYSGFALAIFIPALFMLVVSFFRNRMLHILASGIGIISLGKEMMEYHSQIGLFQSSSIIAIGSWIGMILFIIGVIISLKK